MTSKINQTTGIELFPTYPDSDRPTGRSDCLEPTKEAIGNNRTGLVKDFRCQVVLIVKILPSSRLNFLGYPHLPMLVFSDD